MSDNKPSGPIDESGLDKVAGGAGGAGGRPALDGVSESLLAIVGMASGKGYVPPGETKAIGANPALEKAMSKNK